MEPFEINVNGTMLTVCPLSDGSFNVYDGAISLGIITPMVRIDLEVEWVTADLFAKQYANAIGKAIEAKEK